MCDVVRNQSSADSSSISSISSGGGGGGGGRSTEEEPGDGRQPTQATVVVRRPRDPARPVLPVVRRGAGDVIRVDFRWSRDGERRHGRRVAAAARHRARARPRLRRLPTTCPATDAAHRLVALPVPIGRRRQRPVVVGGGVCSGSGAGAADPPAEADVQQGAVFCSEWPAWSAWWRDGDGVVVGGGGRSVAGQRRPRDAVQRRAGDEAPRRRASVPGPAASRRRPLPPLQTRPLSRQRVRRCRLVT